MKIARYPGGKIQFVAMFCFLSITAVTLGKSAHAQTGKFDGIYAGSQTLTDSGPVTNYSQCLRGPFKRKLVVKDGIATYTFNPTYQGRVIGTINADGDVSGAAREPSGGVSLSGKIAGGAFTGEVWSLYCTYTLQLKRVR
ncbi:MAG TPA: hypothetical protein VN900_10850 [Stellaceae bacterium]|jgi:hypothetical protein|nr:hypothetical protein [Stellaceae bacterium]